MKKFGIARYALVLAVVIMLALEVGSIGTALYADEETGVSISDLLSEDNDAGVSPSTGTSNTTSNNDKQSNNANIIDSITESMDYSKADSEAVTKAGSAINKYVGWVIKILAYVITAGLTLSIMIDIVYIVIPVSRKYLANGYMGNAAAGGTPQTNGMNNNLTPGMGMPGMGMGMGMNAGMGMNRYGAMNGMGGMGGMADSQMAARNQPSGGRIQFLSNAALNAVATESVLGTDGKGQSAFKVYVSDMIVKLIITAVLITLCLTGIVSKLGFMLGDFIVNLVSKINF